MSLINYSNEGFSKIYYDYYNNEAVLYEIVKQLQGREVTLMGFSRDGFKEYIFRCIKAHNLDYLKQNFNGFNFFNRYYNIYKSVTLLNNMPQFSFNMVQRMEQQRKFNEEFMNYVYGIDFFIDFDGDKVTKDNLYNNKDSWDALWREVQIVKHLFDTHGVPYTIKNSSDNGFHIEIADKYISGTLQEKLQFNMKLIRDIKQLFALETPDVNIYNFRRIWKLPYTIDIRSGAVALPLGDNDFNLLKGGDKGMLTPEAVVDVRITNIRNRGLLEREFNYNKFIKLMEDMELLELKKNITQQDATETSILVDNR